MTKRPIESHDVEGFDGPAYDLNILCAAPGCLERADDTHHVWRRSFLGGPFTYVKLPDDSTLGNIIGLCRKHHIQVTDDAAWITWENSQLCWTTDNQVTLPLAFQPPHALGEVRTPPSELIPEAALDSTLDDVLTTDLTQTVVHENECPTCHQPFPKPKVERQKEEKRPRRTWSITVPVDQRENGAETLDTLLEEARLEMAKAGIAYGGDDSTRWAVLAGALGLFITHFDTIVAAA